MRDGALVVHRALPRPEHPLAIGIAAEATVRSDPDALGSRTGGLLFGAWLRARKRRCLPAGASLRGGLNLRRNHARSFPSWHARRRFRQGPGAFRGEEPEGPKLAASDLEQRPARQGTPDSNGIVRSAVGTSTGTPVAAETKTPRGDPGKGALPLRADRITMSEVDMGRSIERDRSSKR